MCAAGKYFVAADRDCQACALRQEDDTDEVHSEVANQANAGADWASSEAECTCRAGFERVNDLCRACAQGKYRVDLFKATCLYCQAKQYFIATDRECGTCALQQANSQEVHSEVANQADRSADWASSEAECTCRVGFPSVKGMRAMRVRRENIAAIYSSPLVCYATKTSIKMQRAVPRAIPVQTVQRPRAWGVCRSRRARHRPRRAARRRVRRRVRRRRRVQRRLRRRPMILAGVQVQQLVLAPGRLA